MKIKIIRKIDKLMRIVIPKEYLIRFEEVLSDTPDKILNIFKKLNF